MSQSLFYWITYSYNAIRIGEGNDYTKVSILILLDYLFLCIQNYVEGVLSLCGLNPYFIGLPILISESQRARARTSSVSILILLDYLFLSQNLIKILGKGTNRVSILILLDYLFL